MTDIQGRSHTDILCGHLLEDKNELWLGTITGGVFVFTVSDSLIFKKQLYKNTNKENALTSDGVLDMMRSRDKMYLCMEAGINIVDLNINSIISIRKKSGLADDRIMSTLSDGKGNIWISTHQHAYDWCYLRKDIGLHYRLPFKEKHVGIESNGKYTRYAGKVHKYSVQIFPWGKVALTLAKQHG